MVKRKKLSEKKWYNGAVIACIGVAFYALLMNLGAVTAAVRSFLGNFRPIFLGIVLAYIFNSIAKYFYYKVFRWMKLGKRRWSISVILSVVLVLLAIDLLLGMLLPQLIQSIGLLSETFDSYTDAAIKWIDSGALGRMLDTQQLELRAQNAVDSISNMLSVNIPQILSAAAYYGKNLLTWFIALILSLYMLIDKKRVMAGVWRLVNLTLRKETSEKVMDFVLRCDTIMISFLVQSLLDALIVSAANAAFMLICGMQYVGLITTAVGVTNLVPTFGPLVGAGFGAVVLLMVNPRHALMFLIFSIALQTVDGYILKPKLFSGSLGVSGLLILSAGVVLGNMFGVLGVLLSIPAAAVLNFIYNDYFMPGRVERKNREKLEGLRDAPDMEPAENGEQQA